MNWIFILGRVSSYCCYFFIIIFLFSSNPQRKYSRMDFADGPLPEIFPETHNILSRLAVQSLQSLEFYRYTNTFVLGYYER